MTNLSVFFLKTDNQPTAAAEPAAETGGASDVLNFRAGKKLGSVLVYAEFLPELTLKYSKR